VGRDALWGSVRRAFVAMPPLYLRCAVALGGRSNAEERNAMGGETLDPARGRGVLRSQSIPVKMYRSDDRLGVAAPMPGVLPEDIVVEVTTDGRLLLRAELRGTLKGVNEALLDEWEAGGYSRELELPNPVDATLANVTYGNGVVVVVLPLSQQTRPARLTLAETGRDCGMRAGSAGHPVRPVSTLPHRAGWAQPGGD